MPKVVQRLLVILQLQQLQILLGLLTLLVVHSDAFLISNPSLRRLKTRSRPIPRQPKHIHGGFLSKSKSKSVPLSTSASSEDEGAEAPNPAPDVATVAGVTLKMAFDANYAVADMAPPSMKSERFTCPASLDLVHKLRRNSDAVLVGRGTVVQDDCTLTVRRVDLCDEEGRNGGRTEQPARVVIDPQLKLLRKNGDGEMYKLLKDGYKTIIYHNCCDNDDEEQQQQQNLDENVKLVQLSQDEEEGETTLSAKQIIHDLQTHQNIQHIMVEGGPATAMQFLAEKMVDRAMIFKAPSVTFVQPMESGMGDEALENAGLVKVDCIPCGDDFVEYWVRRKTIKGEQKEGDADVDADDVLIDEWPGKTICIERGWPY